MWSEATFSSSNICLDAEQLSSCQPVRSSCSRSHRGDENMLPALYSCGQAGSRGTGPTRKSSYRSPNHGHQAKRARVENIIKGMTSCPVTHCTEVAASQHLETDCTQDTDGTEELPSPQRTGSGGIRHSQTIGELPESQHLQLRQLRTKFMNLDEVRATSEDVKEEDGHTGSPCSHTLRESYSQLEKNQGWKKVKLMNYIQTRPERVKLIADVLKYELSQAVSRSIDYIFNSMPLLQTPPTREGRDESPLWKDDICRLSHSGGAEVPDVQTEALSLVMQKPRPETTNKFTLQSRAEPPVSVSVDFPLSGDQLSESGGSAGYHRTPTCLTDGHSKFSWSSVKVRSKVNSRAVRSLQPRTGPPGSMLLESLYHPVKMEPEGRVKNDSYILKEGLSTNHLKKAKLMFFYTRYPSSVVLKMCFQDVQFTRCITSQLIKWFSNFREFYYIQMEKFARHALMDGVVDVRGLTVGRESELFRALNTHYNKANDLQVPDRFLEVAEITLREFYVAISQGKDRDPSWKKVIYKVICKLDSDVPADLISHHAG